MVFPPHANIYIYDWRRSTTLLLHLQCEGGSEDDCIPSSTRGISPAAWGAAPCMRGDAAHMRLIGLCVMMNAPPPHPDQGCTSIVTSVAFSPDGQKLAAGSDDNMARVWDLSTGKPSMVLEVSVMGRDRQRPPTPGLGPVSVHTYTVADGCHLSPQCTSG